MEARTYTMDARADAVEATRGRILAAARAMFFERWWDEVTLNGIASAAGVSHQTVLNHFGSKDAVLSAVAEQVHAEVVELREPARPGDTATAVAVLMAQYEASGLANVRAVYQEHRAPALKAALDAARDWHRAWVERVFDHALPPSGAARRQKLAAFLAATELTAWKSLRHDYGFSKRDTAAAITQLVEALEARS
jgi:AcrR family transcriptional regulator